MPEHEYLEFGGADWKALAPGIVNSAGETIVDFLKRIRDKFRGTHSSPQSNDSMPQAVASSETGGQETEGAEMSELTNGNIEQ